MQSYGRLFARVYNRKWVAFAKDVAPRIREFYEGTSIGQTHRSLLDVCCGTGQLARHFLEHGYQVTGIDLSEEMLQYARENTAPYLETGQVAFIRADAVGFTLDAQVGLAVSTYDALNHLEDLHAVRRCFARVREALVAGGLFIFDLNTQVGLMRRWNSTEVEDREDAFLVVRGSYDGQAPRAAIKVSGFARTAEGLYERFDETVFNTVFPMQRVKDALLEDGWQRVHCARVENLAVPLDEPEREGRVFFIACK